MSTGRQLVEPGESSFKYLIEHGDYSAAINPIGGALQNLRHRGRDLVVPFDDEPRLRFQGVIAAPWPNRIADGRYWFDDRDYRLSLNEPERGCALHGLVYESVWQVRSRAQGSIKLSCTIPQQSGYPFTIRLTAHYRLDYGGLHGTLTAENIGSVAAPYGACAHPYLTAGPSALDEWVLQIPAGSFLEVTPDRLLPTKIRSVAGHELDFRLPRRIGATKIDHAFTGIEDDGASSGGLTLRDPTGTGVGITWDKNCGWLQVHTADRDELPTRLGLAVEPMTCPPNAFNSRQDLITLQPGERHQMDWRIFTLRSARQAPTN